jgi:hypothetical protein
MVADLHKGGLRKHIGDLITQIPAEDCNRKRRSPKDRVLACLRLLDSRNRFVRHARCSRGDPACPRDWLDVAMDSHTQLRFDGMVMSDELYEQAGMATCIQAAKLDSALDAPFWTGRQPDKTVRKIKEDFRAALNPVLRHAKKVTLIDPYINPCISRWMHIVDLVDELTGLRSGGHVAGWNAHVHIHAGDPQKSRHRPQSAADRLAVWETELAKLPRRFRITVFLWSKDISGPELHDRYIITNQTGVSCPGGLDCYEDISDSAEAVATSTWSLMSEEAITLHLGEYSENGGLYHPLGKREFVPAGIT